MKRANGLDGDYFRLLTRSRRSVDRGSERVSERASDRERERERERERMNGRMKEKHMSEQGTRNIFLARKVA